MAGGYMNKLGNEAGGNYHRCYWFQANRGLRLISYNYKLA